ncbi:MAG: TDP-N-acetylfucosamine:lipid II N-acetylfucosaminyltransferase [Muribaculaceae bacterium]|nr:TDP-N-acetylfucosamine:lipid II N-acetylfucosaminyltransferase [Muribaculaceae bacterium]
MNILNFVTDDKFLDLAIINHDSVGDNVSNRFALVINPAGSKESYEFKYIKTGSRIDILYPNEIIRYIDTYAIDAIILHSLYSIPLKIIPKIKQNIPILWLAWGYDIYENPTGTPLIKLDKLYLPHTKIAVDLTNAQRRGPIKNKLALLRDYLLSHKIIKTSQVRNVEKALKRINFFSGIIDMEYKLMKNIPDFKAEESVYVYSPLSNNAKHISSSGINILLGNSANPTNNHIDILNILKERGIDSSKIIVPLNYGGSPIYTNTVCQHGDKLFGEQFAPLVTFLEKEVYTEYIRSCGFVIIGTMRQQAMGNIHLALDMGAKIFLFKDSILYRYLRDKGYIVFTIEEDLTREGLSLPLSKEDAEYNRDLKNKLLSKKWNKNAMLRIYDQLQNYILNH